MAISCCGPAREAVSPEYDYLETSWQAFKKQYLDPRGFVLDRRRGQGQVTSEGQGYAMLQAFWMRDERTFQQVFGWTEKTLKREDGLYAWLWEPNAGGRLVDSNTASDADQEIAFALILASKGFSEPAYLERARSLLQSIRTWEGLALADGGWFPSAGNWANSERIINLSYFLPYAYPYFHRNDPEGDWLRVIDTGYDLIGQALEPAGSVLIPDFVRLASDGSLYPLPQENSLSADFSFDAMRIFWRVAVDCRMHGRLRACSDPLGMKWVIGEMGRKGSLGTRYRVNGERLAPEESLSFYGSLLPALEIMQPPMAPAVLREKLGLEQLQELLSLNDRYYEHNWVWFGLAAYSGLLYERTPSVKEF